MKVLRPTVLSRIDHELPSTPNDEIWCDWWDRYRQGLSCWRDVLNWSFLEATNLRGEEWPNHRDSGEDVKARAVDVDRLIG